MERLTRILLEKETLEGEEFKSIVEAYLKDAGVEA
jgi:ATP-dependent Zn protease